MLQSETNLETRIVTCTSARINTFHYALSCILCSESEGKDNRRIPVAAHDGVDMFQYAHRTFKTNKKNMKNIRNNL